MTGRARIVAIGGGTGLANILRGLKHYPISLSAIVTMTDNGASSGRLSREMGTLPPGDVRKCLAALSSDEALLTKLFEYRFKHGRGLCGHSLGNLLLLALSDITGNFEAAIQESSKILSIKGEVIPSTLDHVSVIGELNNGQMALGEVNIPVMGHRFGINRIHLLPPDAQANPQALYFIKNAHAIVIGPGSLYTSILPNFLIPGIKEAINRSKAMKIYICNVSTERGETENFGVEEHLSALKQYLDKVKIDAILVNDNLVASSQKSNYGQLGKIHNFSTQNSAIEGIPIIKADLIDDGHPLYHDSRKLAEQIWHMLTGQKKVIHSTAVQQKVS